MSQSHHVRHAAMLVPKTLPQRLYALLVMPLAIVGLVALGASLFQAAPVHAEALSLNTLFLAAGYSLARLGAAYVLAALFAIPLALLATHNRVFESILLPLFDVLDSIPVLAFFPVVILLFVRANAIEGAAIFILFINIMWNIVFTVVGGLKVIPHDIKNAARIFGLSGFSYFRRFLAPAIFPQLVTGSILALAEGWNLIIVAEALHAYMPGGTESQDLFGIGSVIVHAASASQNQIFVAALVVMIALIAFINLFIWQRLLRASERFRFE